jgi:hypothetical protein
MLLLPPPPRRHRLRPRPRRSRSSPNLPCLRAPSTAPPRPPPTGQGSGVVPPTHTDGRSYVQPPWARRAGRRRRRRDSLLAQRSGAPARPGGGFLLCGERPRSRTRAHGGGVALRSRAAQAGAALPGPARSSAGARWACGAAAGPGRVGLAVPRVGSGQPGCGRPGAAARLAPSLILSLSHGTRCGHVTGRAPARAPRAAIPAAGCLPPSRFP